MDLVIPIYIDTNSLLDLLASIEGGFTQVEKVTTQNINSKDINREVKPDIGTEFGIPNVLSILKLSLGYSVNWKNSNEETHKKETDRYHTYGSLFHKLKEYLDERNLIKRITDEKSWLEIEESDFVEIRGFFQPNPLANSLEIIDRILTMFLIFQENSSSEVIKPKQQGKLSSEERTQLHELKMRQQTERDTIRLQTKQFGQIREFLKGLQKDIQQEKVRIFVIENKSYNHKAVIILFIDYLRDRTMTEISYKEFRLLGKVVRKIEGTSSNSIELLQGTGIGSIGKTTLLQLTESLSSLPSLKLPEVITEVTGPALEIVPIAIYI